MSSTVSVSKRPRNSETRVGCHAIGIGIRHGRDDDTLAKCKTNEHRELAFITPKLIPKRQNSSLAMLNNRQPMGNSPSPT